LGAKGDKLSADPNIDGVYFLNSFAWSVLSDVATDEQIAIMVCQYGFCKTIKSLFLNLFVPFKMTF